MADLTLKQIKKVLQEELEPINKKLDKHSVKLNGHDSQFKSINSKLDKHSVKLNGHDSQFKSINSKLEDHDSQFQSIAAKLDEHSVKLDSLTLDMIDVQKKTDILPDIYSLIQDTKGKVDDHEERIERLENAS